MERERRMDANHNLVNVVVPKSNCIRWTLRLSLLVALLSVCLAWKIAFKWFGLLTVKDQAVAPGAL